MAQEKVTQSCGCVFCDLALEPQAVGGRPMHSVDSMGTHVPCTKRRMTVEQIMEIAERAKINPSWLTLDEIRALALYLQSIDGKH